MPNLVSTIRLLLLIAIPLEWIQAQSPAELNRNASNLAWTTPQIQGTRVSYETFESTAAKAKVSFHIYKPAVYQSQQQRRFPVVYWLHGSGGGLPGIPRVAALFDAAIEAGKTPPCLVVFVNGLAEGMYVDWKDGSAPIETMIVKELIPHIDQTYRTIAASEGRLLDGYSMGGYGSARLGFKYPDMFKGISIMGGGPLQAELIQTPRAGRQRAAEVLQRVYGSDQEYFRKVSPRELAKENKDAIRSKSMIRQICGDQDETFNNNLAFHEYLEQLQIPHTWTVLEGVDHNPMKTLEKLGDSNWTFYRQVFEQTAEPPKTNRQADFELQLKIDQQERRAIVVNAPIDGSKRPTVLVLHGGQGSAQVMRANSGFDAVARAQGFMVVYPEGTEFAENRHAWNTGHLLRRQVQQSDDIAFLDRLIDRLIDEHGANPSRIYMTGGSNGGMMTFIYAVERPEKLAAVAPVVASMFDLSKQPAVPLPILIINAAQDQEVPLEGGMSKNLLVRRAQESPFKPVREVIDFWVKSNRSNSEPIITTKGTVTTSVYETTDNGATTEYILDAAGAHGWPGSRSRREGTTPISSFSGAERVWEFFKDKERTDPR